MRSLIKSLATETGAIETLTVDVAASAKAG
jgi:hypothetical protein